MQIRKISIVYLAFCSVITGITAQNPYRGTVTDRNGNPIAGVLVTDKSGISTTTDLYGQYEFDLTETPEHFSFSLVGFNPKRIKPKPDMNIKMGRSTIFNSPNYGKHFFFGIQAASAEKSMRAPSLGINLGTLNNSLGWYLDFVLPIGYMGGIGVPEFVGNSYDYLCNIDWNTIYCLTGERYAESMRLSTGIMIPFPAISSLYFDLGLVYGYKTVYEGVTEREVAVCNSYEGFAGEFGLSYRLSHLLVNVKGGYYLYDFDYGFDFNDEKLRVPSGPMKRFDSLSFGLSYIF